MAFEFKIKQKLIFKQQRLNRLPVEAVLERLSNHLLHKENLAIKTARNTVTSTTNKSVLYYNYTATFRVIKQNHLVIQYEYSLIPVFKITVIMILFAAFFSKFSFNSLLVFSGIFILVFFGFNILYINSVLKNMVVNAMIPEGINYEEKLTEEQKEWINNPQKCPACGEMISAYNYICPECGLSINKQNQKKNINFSGFYNTQFNYKYKKPTSKK